MKLLMVTVLAEAGWLFLAVSGPVWAYLLGFAGFVATPALAVEYHERSRELDQRIRYAATTALSEGVSRG